jgi:hypothetical protein
MDTSLPFLVAALTGERAARKRPARGQRTAFACPRVVIAPLASVESPARIRSRSVSSCAGVIAAKCGARLRLICAIAHQPSKLG